MTMDSIIEKVILQSEGGLSDNKSDKGGTTKYGISIKWYSSIDKTITKETIESLTLQQAVALYKKHFSKPMRIEEVNNDCLKEKIFDMCINMGVGQASKLVQRACNILAQKDELVEDGNIGLVTIRKVNFYGGEMLPVLRALQYMFYKNIVDKNTSQKVFWNGWRKRAYV
jgi:lysozyme family protein